MSPQLMPALTSERHSPGYADALARLTAYRHVRSTVPRVHVRVMDPLVRRSLLALAVGVVLILLSAVLAPPT